MANTKTYIVVTVTAANTCLALQVGKMNEILHCDWLPKQSRCSFHACPGLLAASCKKHFPNSHIINPLLTKFVRSRLDIGLVLLQVYGLQLHL